MTDSLTSLIERLRAAFRQWRCSHYTRATSHEIGKRCIITRTICDDCGKAVPPHESDKDDIQRISTKMLYEHFE